MTKTHRRRSSETLYDQRNDAPGDVSPAADHERLMDDLAIRQVGASYVYNGHRYGRLGDAVDYARLIRSGERPGGTDQVPSGPFSSVDAPQGPSAEERTLMSLLAIYYEQGQYRFENYRYDRLGDAAMYARIALRRPSRQASGDAPAAALLQRSARQR